MSIINKMLQELDKRDAAQEPLAAAVQHDGSLAHHVRTVWVSTLDSNLFWGSVAALLLVALVWVMWVMWQIMPRPLATDLAYQQLAQRTSPPVPVQVQPPPAAAPPPESAPDKPEKIDLLRMATEIVTPIRSRGEKKAGPGRREAPPAPQASAPAAGELSAVPRAGRIDKRVDVTPRERAEAEFRRAMSLVNQGRMAEGMDGLRTTLALDSGLEAARQTLVALLLEAKRIDEAASLLEQGLAASPDNLGYAMLLARIYVEHGDAERALALLQKSEAAGRSNAEYHAFVAALFQRFGRHAEAVERYRSALRLAAGAGAWWVGLGISQEALGLRQDAAESFSRARGTGRLNAELLAFVDRRLKQLR